MRFRILAIFVFLPVIECFSQYYSTGQDPASVQWRQITTDKYQLIFPRSFEVKAQYLANIMDIVARHETSTFPAKVPRIPIILHTQSAYSNGITVWAPKRIELYPCSPQQTYAEEWLEQLIIHEYRHAVQISSINRGFSRALYYVFGEQITGGILGLYLPSWFLEGDATVAETALTKTGRGRSALFESTLRAQILEKGKYSYDKATMGSYKTFTPDAYSLGYYLVGQARNHYGAQVWNEAVSRTARLPFMVVPFTSGIRKATGLWKTQLYGQSLSQLDSIWKKQFDATPLTGSRTITRRNPGNYTLYKHPVAISDSTIVAEKSSMDDVNRFVAIIRNTGIEHKLVTPGIRADGYFSAAKDKLVWSELRKSPRWPNRSYAEILLYDLQKGKIITLTRKSRYFAPAISPDGTKIAAINLSTLNEATIDLLELPSGKILQRCQMPPGNTALTPGWSPDGRKIVFTILNEKGESIAILDIATRAISLLLPFEFQEFNGPTYLNGRHILFSTDKTGIENIYALDTVTRELSQVISAKFAAYDACITPDGKSMIYTDYGSDGAMLAEVPVEPESWTPATRIKNYVSDLASSLALQESVNIQDSVIFRNIFKMNQKVDFDPIEDSIAATRYPVRRYRKAGHLFNPHSWAPLSFEAENLDFNPGVMVLSQNVLSSMFVNAGYEYNLNEQTGKFYSGISYQGLYPVFDFTFDIGNRASWARMSNSAEKTRFTWQETNLKFQVRIPWNFSRGRFSRRLEPSVGTTLIGIRHDDSTPSNFTLGTIQTLDYRVFASNYLRSNQKDMYPRFGQSLDLTFRNSPFSGNDMGSIFGAAINFYFPGMFRHHGVWFYSGYQQRREQDDLAYSFSNLVRLPRGFQGIYDPELLSLQGNYKFPVIYPDLSLGSVLYFKRLKLNLFYDWMYTWEGSTTTVYQSTGAELTVDFHFLRFFAPLEMGLRTIFYPVNGSWGWEFLYSVNLP